jgi:hypothetical protein
MDVHDDGANVRVDGGEILVESLNEGVLGVLGSFDFFLSTFG